MIFITANQCDEQNDQRNNNVGQLDEISSGNQCTPQEVQNGDSENLDENLK